MAATAVKQTGLLGTLRKVRKECTGRKLCLGDVLAALENRGFGPLLLIPTIIVVLPTGAMPGVPDVAGVFMILVALQLLFGRDTPWMPERLQKMGISAKKFDAAMKKATPYLRKIDKHTHRRATAFTHRWFQKIVALFVVMQSVLMMVIGMIPFVPDLLALPILVLALGFSVKDGWLTIAGFALMVVTFGVGIAIALN